MSAVSKRVVTSTDIRRMLDLVSVCCRTEMTTSGRMTKFLRGIIELTHSQVGVVARVRRSMGKPTEVVSLIDMGWVDDFQRQQATSATLKSGHVDPALEGTFEQLPAARQRTCVRRQVVEDGAWYDSAHVADVRRPGQIDDCVYSIYPLQETGHYVCLGLHRAWGDKRAFGERERQIADYLWQSMGWLHEEPMRPQEPGLERGLRTELRPVLEMLRCNASLATGHRKLGLVQAEFKRLVGEVYEHFGVSTRMELLVRLAGGL